MPRLDLPRLDDAACAGHPDPDLWFGPDRLMVVPICRRCPAAEACFEYALTRRVRAGVWGGVDFERAGRARRPDKALRNDFTRLHQEG